MAKFENMTLSYTQIASIPFKTRKTASVSLLDALSRELTPGQRVALFPSYVNKIYASGKAYDAKKTASLNQDMPELDVVSAAPKITRPKTTATPKPDIIPAGLIPDPVTGKPTRVPDQRIASSDIKTGDRFQDVIKNYKSRMMKDLGITDFQADGVLGNLAQESDRFRAYNEYGGGPGIGWAQWTTKQRKEAFLSFASENNLDPKSDEASYRYLVHEIQNRPDLLPGGAKTLERLRETTNAEEAARSFMDNFERPGIPHFDARLQYTNEISEIPYVEDDLGEIERISNVFDLPEEATAEPIKVSGKTTIDGIDATILDYGGEDKNGLGGVPVLKAEGMEGSYDNNSATKSAKPYEGVVFHVTGKQTVAEQLEFQKDSGYGYQYIIDPEGNIIEAADPIKDRPNQIKGPSSDQRHGRLDLSNQNALSIGFITGGGKPTEKQLEAIKKGLPQIYKKLGIPTTMPDGTPNYPVGHGEIQYDRGPDSGLGPSGTAEGYVMAEPLRNAEYWDQLTNYDDEYKPATEDTAVPVVTAPEGPILSSDNVHQPEGSTVDNKRQDRPVTELPPEPTSTPEPKKYTLQDITGLPTGYNAAAGGAEITDPSMIISEDGKKVTRVAETGPEQISVMPRHKSSDVFQENQIMIQQMIEQTSKEEMRKPDIADIKSTPRSSDFGLPRESGQSIQISTVMPKISPSNGKAFADAKMVGRFNKADVEGDMGIVHIDRGYA